MSEISNDFIKIEDNTQDVAEMDSEVLYEYDDTEFIMDSSQLDDSEIGNFFYTADGTKAILVDGQYYIPADTQAIVLQDEGGEEDLNSYVVNNECESIILGEDTDLATSALAETEVVQLIDVDQVKDEEIIYYTSDTITSDQLQKALAAFETELSTADNNETIGNTYMLKQKVKLQQVVDLEDLMRQQNGEETIVIQDPSTDINSEDPRQYQYAVLKDGKLHIQTYDNETDIVMPSSLTDDQSEVNISNIISEDSEIINLSDLDLTKITGKNLMTGQTVTLHEYMNKLHRRINSPTNINSTENKVKLKKKPLTKSLTINYPNTIKNRKKRNLSTLLNKKIHIGKTNTGKNLIGKIVHVHINLSTSQIGQNIETEPNLVSLMPMDENNDELAENVIISNDTNFEDMQNFSISLKEAYVGEVQTLQGEDGNEISENTSFENIQASVTNIENDVQDSGFSESFTDDTQLSTSEFDSIDPDVISNNIEEEEKRKNNVILLVKSHTISKDCYDDICKMLHGLMYMDTIKIKLLKKNLAVKVVLKKFDHETNKYNKNILHIYGYMENNAPSEQDLHPKWRFVPDKNTQDALLAGGIEIDAPLCDINDESIKIEKTCKYPKTVVLNLLINYDKLGRKSVKVLFNPISSNKCTICSKMFSTPQQVQIHLSKSHKVDLSNGVKKCNLCSKMFSDAKSLKLHKESHAEAGTVYKCNLCKETFSKHNKYLQHISEHESVTVECYSGNSSNENALRKQMVLHTHKKMFECVVCHRQFTRQSNLLRHIEIHNKNGGAPFSCDVCGASYCYNSSLTRHMVQNHIVKYNK